MISSAIGGRRLVITGALASSFLLLFWGYSPAWKTAEGSLPGLIHPQYEVATSGYPRHIEDYFEQVFSVGHPTPYAYAALKETCGRVKWREDDVYVKCAGMAAGMTSIISQIKVCLKMAIESGSSLVLPAMPLRDSTDLGNFNFLNGDAYMTYDRWFDAEHLREQIGRVCPRMKIVHPSELGKSVPVKREWQISCGNAWGYQKFSSYFWVGRPYRNYFEDQYRQLLGAAAANPGQDGSKTGITVIEVDSEFLLFRITDDPTGRELRLWNDLSHLVRFRELERQVVHRLLGKMTRPFYGVHFRVENDTMWSSLETQLARDLDALDMAWSMYGRPGQQKPLVYLACGDQMQVEKFVAAGAERGWDVTHKWRLAADDADTTKMINDLAFDFQGAVDMGVMIRSQFFFGITGSAYSMTVANQRDITGRYRGSSLEIIDDEGARNHLFYDLDSIYACCL